ncbi:MAG: lipoate--protein ligase family protein [Pirellulales bacterium]|nr:lipoate--protein ligase family protein [Pirellulales bacterium]
MQLLNLTLDTPAENVALDEALLDAAEAGEISGGVLRLWESPQHVVVLGRSSSADVEVNLTACREHEGAVLRRCSGGGPVVVGPGCLMYAVVLPYETYPQLRAVDLCHQFVLQKIAGFLAPLGPDVTAAGISDLAICDPTAEEQRKFSGNAMRSKRSHILYHGTLLYDFELERIGQFLASPTREPDYRNARIHTEFVTNLPLTRSLLVQALVEGWEISSKLESWPKERTLALVHSKYQADKKWNIYLPDQEE